MPHRNTGHNHITPQSSPEKNGSGSSSRVIRDVYIQSLVFTCMSLLPLSLSYGVWGMKIQEMVLQLKNSLPSFSTCVLRALVSDTLESGFSDQMRLFQGKFNAFRSDLLILRNISDTFEGCAWHFHLQPSTQSTSSCHLHWIPLLGTFSTARSSGHSLRSALEL